MPCNDHGWKVRFAYRVTQAGTPNSRPCGANDPAADGEPTEVCITKAWFVNANESVEQALPLTIFPLDELIDAETAIGQKLDEEQTR